MVGIESLAFATHHRTPLKASLINLNYPFSPMVTHSPKQPESPNQIINSKSPFFKPQSVTITAVTSNIGVKKEFSTTTVTDIDTQQSNRDLYRLKPMRNVERQPVVLIDKV